VSVGFWWTLSNSTETWQSYLSLGGILCIVSLLIALAFIDAEHMYLPDDIVLPLLVFSVFFSCIRIDRAAMELLAGGLIGLVCFYAIHLLTFKKGFGLGDVKLAGILGTLLGSSLVLWGLYAGVCLATLYSLALMVLKQKTIKDIIPFAPFLVTGTLLVFLFQYPLLQTVNTMFFGNF
jgi:leader peptidase (prepilin peptidase)/N-methyltransferase